MGNVAVVKGNPDAEELAAVVALLSGLAGGTAVADRVEVEMARWCGAFAEREFQAPGSWRNARRW